MRGLGTLANCSAIIAGGLLGALFGKKISEKVRDALMKVMGVSVMFTGLTGSLSQMLVPEDGKLGTYGGIMLIVCLALGTAVGEAINIERLLDRFGEKLKSKIAKNDEGFTSAFVSASLVVSVGAMAVVGSIEDGLAGNPSTLLTKSLLDLIIVLTMASSLGVGCMFSFIPVGILQGGITLAAGLLSPVLSAGTVIDDLSLVGNVMIFCIGINLVFGKKFRVGNMLPSLVFCLAYSLASFYIVK